MLYYIDYFNSLSNLEILFWFCALVGTGMLFFQLLLNIIGVVDIDGFDANDGTVADNSHDPNRNSSDVRRFKWLSVQAITGFLMMFGWTSITCQKEFGLQNTTAIGISIVVGVLSAVISGSIFKFTKKLQSSGSVYRIEDAIGKEAFVYHRIPKGGMGKISISLHHFTHEIDAVTYHTEELPSFTPVKIIEKKDDNTVVVTPL